MGIPMVSAPRTIWRYVLRQALGDSLLALGALALLWVVVTLLKDLVWLQIASEEPRALGRLLLVLLPAYLSYIVPAALVCGVMVALSRMAGDGEIVALRASGLGHGALLPPIALLGAGAVALGAYVSFDLQPRSHLELKQLRRELIQASSLIHPGEVRQLGTDRTLFVSEVREDEGCPLRGVVISDYRDQERTYYLTARCGRVVDLEAAGSVGLDLQTGAVHFSGRSDGYDRISFESSQLELDLDELDFFRKKLNQYEFSELTGSMIGSNYPRSRIRAEIQRRLAFPLSGLLLPLLAIPLSLGAGQRGKSAGVIQAIAMMTGYWMLFTSLHLAAEKDAIPSWALWAPNALLLLATVYLIRRSARPAS